MVDRSAADGTAVRDSAYLFYVLLLFAPGPLVTLLEGQFSFIRLSEPISRHGYRAAQFEDAFARFLPHEPNIRTLKSGREKM